VFGGLVAHQLEGVAAFDQGLPLGRQAFQIDGLHLAAVLFALAAALRLLIVVKLALDPVGGPVEDVDRRPEEIVEVGLEAGVLQGEDQGVEDVGDGAGDMVALRKRSGIGLIREGTVAVKLEFAEDVVGGGRGFNRLNLSLRAQEFVYETRTESNPERTDSPIHIRPDLSADPDPVHLAAAAAALDQDRGGGARVGRIAVSPVEQALVGLGILSGVSTSGGRPLQLGVRRDRPAGADATGARCRTSVRNSDPRRHRERSRRQPTRPRSASIRRCGFRR
jgi:hypothetical protein